MNREIGEAMRIENHERKGHMRKGNLGLITLCIWIACLDCQGPKGPQGLQGGQGPSGPTGAQGTPGVPCISCVNTSSLQDGSVTSSKIASMAVTTSAIANGAVTSSKARLSWGIVHPQGPIYIQPPLASPPVVITGTTITLTTDSDQVGIFNLVADLTCPNGSAITCGLSISGVVQAPLAVLSNTGSGNQTIRTTASQTYIVPFLLGQAISVSVVCAQPFGNGMCYIEDNVHTG